MIEEFLNKIYKGEYISKHLWLDINKENKNVIPLGFDLEKHNDKFLEREYDKYKDYFLSMYKGIDDEIVLDKEQIKAILSEEDYSLIIAGAGAGKTTTMVSLVKYLVDIKKVDASKICVMSYSRKTTEELQDRINVDFQVPAKVSTFHSLGYSYIREMNKDRKCYVVDNNKKEEIFMDYFRKCVFNDKEKIFKIVNNFEIIKKIHKETGRYGNFIFASDFLLHFDKYDNFDEYFEEYKLNQLKKEKKKNLSETVRKKIENKLKIDTPITINNEIVKSRGEAIITNFLYCNGINYEYEKIYEDLLDNNSIYRPDWTLELNGEKIYLEYFGLSTDDKVNRRYDAIRKKKEELHKQKKNKFISISYMKEEELVDCLKKELEKYGFELKPKSDEEIFLKILDNNPTSQLFPFKDFLYDVIENIKSSNKRDNYDSYICQEIEKMDVKEQEQAKIQFEIIDEFYKFYQDSLRDTENYGFDYSDMIYYGNKAIDEVYNNRFNFEYLIIDEYQDISMQRYKFTEKIIKKNNCKIVAVGDDWQSIYSFTGSNIEYIYNFLKYFEGAELFKISKTYRNCQELTDYSTKFVLKNQSQISKEMISNKRLSDPIKFWEFDNGEELVELKKIILEIHKNNPEDKILILARSNKSIKNCLDKELLDDIGTKVKFVGYDDIDIDAMSIHKSKGLTSDQVIVIGLNKSFPCGSFSEFWIDNIFKFKKEEEMIADAEERRLFYVALTRTKNYVYLLKNKNPNIRSNFVDEIEQIIHDRKIEVALNDLFKFVGLKDSSE